MTACGNIKNLSIENQEAISTSGIHFKHIGIRDPLCESPKRRQHRVYRAIINDRFWVDDDDPPWHLFYISGYDGLAFHVPTLVKANYHMLVASTGPDKDLFFRFANISFDWNSLIRGENLIGHRREFSLEDYKALVASTIREDNEKKKEEREKEMEEEKEEWMQKEKEEAMQKLKKEKEEEA